MLAHTSPLSDNTCLCSFLSSALCFLDRQPASNIQVFLFSLHAGCEFTLQHNKVVSPLYSLPTRSYYAVYFSNLYRVWKSSSYIIQHSCWFYSHEAHSRSEVPLNLSFQAVQPGTAPARTSCIMVAPHLKGLEHFG